jgi:hypothetical protein
VTAAFVFGIAKSALDDGFNLPSPAIRQELQHFDRFINVFTANERRERTHLPRGNVAESVFGVVNHFSVV